MDSMSVNLSSITLPCVTSNGYLIVPTCEQGHMLHNLRVNLTTPRFDISTPIPCGTMALEENGAGKVICPGALQPS